MLPLWVVVACMFAVKLPDPLFSTPYSTVLLDRSDLLLGAKIAADGQWRFPYTGLLPDKFKTAIISYEDKNFYYHPGGDPLAILRAFYLNIRQAKVVSGGSTLSMQLIRLARHNPERGYFEKMMEIMLAMRLEMSMSKDHILAHYAAHAPFGGNVVGLEMTEL